MNVIERIQAPTPKFFRILRTIGVALATAGGALLVAPVALPAGLLAIAGYLTVAGTVMSAVSQAAVESPSTTGVTEILPEEPAPAKKAAKKKKDAAVE